MSFSDAECQQAIPETSDEDDSQFDRSLGSCKGTVDEPIIQEELLTATTPAAIGGGLPDTSNRSTRFGVAGYIIVMEFCERLAYYGFSGSLVLLFESELGMTNEAADSQFALWSGVCYAMSPFGGWLADSYLGRYNSIVVFSVFYLVGLFMATGSCIPGRVSQPLLFFAMYLLALGTGGIKSSVSVFGADQFDDDNPRDVREKLSFFNWFYWSINLGALVSFTLVSYVCQYGLPFLGGSDWGFMVGYSIPCIAMTLALVLFLAGSHKYRRFPPSGSMMSRAVGLVFEAAWSPRGADGQLRGSGDTEEGAEGRPKWLQRASERMGGSYTHDEVTAVSRVWQLIPFLALQVPYYAVYAQMNTAFQNQGCQMDLSVFGFDIPVATLNMFDTLAVLCLIPVVDRGVYPWLRRLGYEPTKLRKIGAGLILAGLAVLVAAWVEIARRGSVEEGEGSMLSPCQREGDYDPEEFQQFWRHQGESESYHRPAYCHKVPGCDELGPDGLLLLECIDCETPPLSSSVSIMWQIPQFILIGASEILSIVTSLEFFYDEAPTTMRGVSAGLNLFTTALGSWATIPLLRLVNSGAFGTPWLPHDLNKGHLEVYFCLLAGLVLVSFVLFVIVARGYHYKSPSDASVGYSSITDYHLIDNGVEESVGGSGQALEPVQVSELDGPGGSKHALEDHRLLPQQRGPSGERSGSPT